MRAPRLARLGLRTKMTIVFAASMALVLAALGVFVYFRFENSLDGSIDQGLRSRADDVRALVIQADSGLRQAAGTSLAAPGERFAEIIGEGGRVIDSTRLLPGHALLSASQQARSRLAPTLLDRKTVAGAAGASRLLAIPVAAQGQQLIVLVGTSLRQRDASLAEIRKVLLIGGPAALLLASLLGYAVAAVALRSIESMRRRALRLSVLEPGQRLPVPPSNDELARLARTLNDMLARNDVAFERERTFVADASHELRSPLAILRAELDVALIGESTPRELRDAVSSAAEEADRLSALAEDLLLLARSDRGAVTITSVAIDARDCLKTLSDRFSQRAAAAGATIRTSAPAGLEVFADPRRLEQALGNLTENALHHGARSVVVQAKPRGEALVEFHVTDDGPGFPPDFLPLAFERFARSDRSRTGAGAGLGLSIVRAIARAHGGEAHVANDPCGGAHVCLTLPRPTVGDRPLRQSQLVG
jgi:two-component system, OmpR family, sensor kinase